MNFYTKYAFFYMMILIFDFNKIMCYYSNCGAILPPNYSLDCYDKNTIKSINNNTSLILNNENSSKLEVDNFSDYDSKNMKCCFLTNLTDITGESNLCYLVDNFQQYTNNEDQIYFLDNSEFNIDCNTDSSGYEAGQICGHKSPSNYLDCFKYSITGNSCCFYKNYHTHFTSCFWLGRFSKIINVISNSSNYNVTCSANKIKFSMIFFVLIFFLIDLDCFFQYVHFPLYKIFIN